MAERFENLEHKERGSEPPTEKLDGDSNESYERMRIALLAGLLEQFGVQVPKRRGEGRL
ncbi:MAG: hypothetical protein ACYC9Q_15215 [Bacillota bacterium]